MIELIRSYKTQPEFVSVEFKHIEKNTNFTIEYSNIHAGTGETVDFQLTDHCVSSDQNLQDLIESAIADGADNELYLEIIEAFTSSDCEDVLCQPLPVFGYIQKHYRGSQTGFADALGVTKQQITKWINGDFLIIGNELFSKRRDIPDV